MILSTQFILEKFAHVFKNEFNERKVLHRAVDEKWGLQVAYNFVSGNGFSGTRWGVERANALRNLSRTLLLLEDKNGNVGLFAFWLDFTKNEYGYSEIHKQSLYLPCYNRIYK
jgi:hypothetical protein